MIAPDLQPLAQPIDNLRILEDNPRRGDVLAVARSYERFGQRKPIVALRDGTVIAGNHQLQAARSLGWTEIAVVYVDDDEVTAKAYALADNRISDLGTYEDDLLVEYLTQIRDSIDDISVTGYTEDDVQALLVFTSKLADDESSFLADIMGEQASLGTLEQPREDMETLTFVLPKEQKLQVIDALRDLMKAKGLDNTSEALYYKVVR